MLIIKFCKQIRPDNMLKTVNTNDSAEDKKACKITQNAKSER